MQLVPKSLPEGNSSNEVRAVVVWDKLCTSLFPFIQRFVKDDAVDWSVPERREMGQEIEVGYRNVSGTRDETGWLQKSLAPIENFLQILPGSRLVVCDVLVQDRYLLAGERLA